MKSLRLYYGQVPVVAQDIVKTLIKEGDLEVTPENEPEVQIDAQSVLREYIRLDRELNDETRDIISKEGGSFGRVKSRLCRRKGVDLHEDPVGYIIQQLTDIFLHSHFVDEIFATDRDLRKRMKPILEKHMSVQEELDEEVRDKIKNLEEGSQAWEIEYQKAMEKLKRTKNLE